MRFILALLFIPMLATASEASCANFPDWYSAQRELELGGRYLDGGMDPREPDGIACEGNRGYPGDDLARQAARDIRAELRTEQERERRREEILLQNEKDRIAEIQRDRARASCRNYDSREQAQRAFDAVPEDLAALDRDGNGIVCEEDFASISRDGGPQDENDRRPEGSDPFFLNTWENRGIGVAPRTNLSTTDWPKQRE